VSGEECGVLGRGDQRVLRGGLVCPYLHHQILAGVVECLRHLRVDGGELAVLRRLDALVYLLIAEPLPWAELKLASSAVRLLPA